jgi:Bacterial archaeo-eukaryotic release factor family 3
VHHDADIGPIITLPAVRPLTPQTVLALQGYRSYPSISILLTTRPGPCLDPADAERFDALVREARTRLAAERCAGAGAVSAALDELPATLEGPVQHAVALFVSAATIARVDLPVEVVDRTVVDPTFATRDLVRALHRTPRHVVLVLAANEAQLFDGTGDVLVPVRRGPLRDLLHRPGEPPRRAFLHTVDQALGAHLRVHPAPLVLVGSRPVLSSFRSVSRNTARLAGTIRGDHPHAPDRLLRASIREVLEQYLLSRRAEALELLAVRREHGRALLGIQDAWFGARWERPEMLMVEQGFFYPARIGEDGDPLYPADDPHAPDVIDDVVDELIELVLARGGWIALLEDGTLPDGTGVALTLRGN